MFTRAARQGTTIRHLPRLIDSHRLLACLGGVILVFVFLGTAAATGGTYTPPRCPTVTYHTAPHLQAQALCMNIGVVTHDTEAGTFLFLTPGGDAGPGGDIVQGVRPGAGIFQDNGTLVWWHRSDARKVFNLTVVQYRGNP